MRQWQRSGLSAGGFAARIGVKPGTLTYWGWRLKREAVDAKCPGNAANALPASEGHGGEPAARIELRAAASEERFEVGLDNSDMVA